jgi:hypothetical protein
LDGGPALEIRPRREIAIRFAYELEGDERCDCALVFEGVEAFKCTYYHSRDSSMLEAYDRLISRGQTSWLNEIAATLTRNGGNAEGLRHLMINFDDGPAVEVLCRSFRVENSQRSEEAPGAR